MIEIPTTFIIGAGASVPYGFPSGQKLVEMLCDPNMDQVLESVGHKPLKYQRFSTALKESQLTSIDTFLEQQDEEMQDFGRLAIASKLLPCEKSAPLTCVLQVVPKKPSNPGGGHWLRHLWESMRAETLEGLADNQARFIVFNYDRILEQYLWMVIRRTYPGHSEIQYADALDGIDIVHPYGSLGAFAFGDRNLRLTKGEGKPVAFGEHSVVDMRNAAQAMRLISEQRESGAPFEHAVSLMGESDRLIFLGFGYEKTNMERLCVADWCKRKLKKASGTAPFAHATGSAYGLARAEAYKIRATYFLDSPNCLGSTTDDSLTFLRSRVDLGVGGYDKLVTTRYAEELSRLLGVDAPT